MGHIKRNFQLTVVILLNLLITVLSLVLGCLMYTSNSKSIAKNLVYVEMTDFISNIRYGLHFGKPLYSYYGMEDQLTKTLEKVSDVEEMYIVSDEAGLLFKTQDTEPDAEILSMDAGSNTVRGDAFYCAFELTNNSRVITCLDISEKKADWIGYYRYLSLVSFAGFFASAFIMIIVWRRIKNIRLGYKILIGILAVWIIIISSYVGYSAYKEYNSSIVEMEEGIANAIRSDLDAVHSLGVKDENIGRMDEYLERYSNNISEIDSILLEGGDSKFVISSSYMRKVILDYLLQTLLFLAFSSMILAEYHIFVSGTGINEAGVETDG